MPYVTADRVRETSTTTGTGSYTLDGASPNFRAFSGVCANGDTAHYAAVDIAGSGWEVGLGTWSTGNTLARTTILASSNGGSAVNWSAGTRDIFITSPAAFLASRASAGANSDITSLTGLTTALSVAQGGTGATTAEAARTSLGAAASSHTHAIGDVTGLQAALDAKAGTSHTHTASQISDSTATGRSVLTAADAAAARTAISAAASGAVGSSGLTMSTARLLGRTTASSGAIEEITVGSGLTLSGGVLSSGAGSTPTFQSQTFTANGTFTVPTGITKVRVTCVGGGGGGGGGRSVTDPCSGSITRFSGGNGGSGGAAFAELTVTSGQSITVTIGAGGAGSTATGSTGGTTSFGSLLSATGGVGGTTTSAGASGTPSSSNQWGGFSPSSFGTPRSTGTSAAAAATVTGTAILVGAGGLAAFGADGGAGRGGSGGAVYVEWIG